MHCVIFRSRETLNGFGLNSVKRSHARIAVAAVFLAELILSIPAQASYIQTNLVSDGSISGTTADPNLVNPWGMAASPTSPFWVADNGSGSATIYDGAGVPNALVVTIPPPRREQ
jgi:hypothetical protein